MIPLLLTVLLAGDGPRIVALETPAGARQPQVGVSRTTRHVEGTRFDATVVDVYVVCGTKDAVHVSVSRDGGESFEPARKIGDVGALALGLRRGPRIALAGEALVVTAIAGAKGGGQDEDVLAWHSTDRGASWTYDGRVNEVAAAAREGLHALAGGPKGELFCAWIDVSKEGPRICGASSSSDSLGRWSETRVVFGEPDGICPCCHPSAAFDAKGRLFVMWRGHDGGSRDMVVATSDDLGATFTKPAKLGEGTWKLEACPMDGGAIVFGGGRLRSVWRRESQIFRAETTGAERPIGEGEQPSLAFAPDGEYDAWLARRGGALLLLRPRASEPIRLDEQASDPVLATGVSVHAPVYAAWESGPVAEPRIVVARVDARR